MIHSLYIQNVALIQEVELCFDPKLNILSGETGSGKSMVIDSLLFLLGGKVDGDFIRRGENKTVVEGCFSVKDETAGLSLQELGIELDEDQMLLMHRTITEGLKNTCRINGKICTLGILKDVGKLLVDVHGQHQHQSLFNANKHIELLDRFCDEQMNEDKALLAQQYKEYKEICKTISTLSIDEKERLGQMDLYTFQIQEIAGFHLQSTEEETLTERKKIISASEKLARNCSKLLEIFNGGQAKEEGVVDGLYEAVQYMGEIKEIDKENDVLLERIQNLYAEAEDISKEIRNYYENVEHDPKALDEIEERLNGIYHLKRKYGNSIPEILQYYKKIKEKVSLMENSADEIERLEGEKGRCVEKAMALCRKISKMRCTQGAFLEQAIVNVLQDLGMKDAKLSIQIMPQEHWNQNGYDQVEFLISSNAGEPLKPLSKIASGGEMSRVMLALKTVLAKVDHIDTFIFDEIDTGVSGRTAQKVGQKLSLIAQGHQILCITHLPQIASMADAHFLIEKKSEADKTTTHVEQLDKDASIKELARLIGGAVITEQTMKAASEMIELAQK